MLLRSCWGLEGKRGLPTKGHERARIGGESLHTAAMIFRVHSCPFVGGSSFEHLMSRVLASDKKRIKIIRACETIKEGRCAQVGDHDDRD